MTGPELKAALAYLRKEIGEERQKLDVGLSNGADPRVTAAARGVLLSLERRLDAADLTVAGEQP
jgi:hypothetical protein